MGFLSFLRKVDPFLEPQTRKEDFNHLHTFLILLTCVAILVFAIFEFVGYARRDTTETFSLVPMKDYNGVPITVDVSCAGTCGPVTVQQDLSGVPDCSTASSSQTFTTYPFQFTTALCAAALQSQGLSLQISGLGTSASGSAVSVTVSSQPMVYQVDMQEWHRKTIVVGLSVKEGEGSQSQETYLSNVQYDGSTPTADAILRIRLDQLANLFSVSRPGSLLTVLGAIGGFASLLIAALKIVVSSVDCVKSCARARQRRKQEKCLPSQADEADGCDETSTTSFNDCKKGAKAEEVGGDGPKDSWSPSSSQKDSNSMGAPPPGLHSEHFHGIPGSFLDKEDADEGGGSPEDYMAVAVRILDRKRASASPSPPPKPFPESSELENL